MIAVSLPRKRFTFGITFVFTNFGAGVFNMVVPR